MSDPFDNIKLNQTRFHESLPEDLRLRALAIHKLVYPYGTKLSPEQWVDGFCFDMHPDREIAIWEPFAAAFARAAAGKTDEKKREAWIMVCSLMAEIPVTVAPEGTKMQDLKAMVPKLAEYSPRSLGVGGGKSAARLWATIQAELKKRLPNG